MTKRYSLKALVVDDNGTWLRALTRLISEAGYQVVTAQTYKDALQIIRGSESPPDLVVTDVRLEDDDSSNEDGLELLLEMRRRGQLAASMVVTGYPSDRAKDVASQVGAVYLEKGQFRRDKFHQEHARARELLAARVVGRVSVSSAETTPHLTQWLWRQWRFTPQEG
jgi:ActR/RegA family two-component response regulator